MNWIRVNVMLDLFQEFVSPEEKKLAVMADGMGGKAALDSEQSMRKLADAEVAFNTPLVPDNRRTGSRSLDLVELQREINENPDEAIEKNADFFSSKFDIQTRQIKEDIERTVRREGDRIIEAVTAGPRDRIVDPVWREDFCACGMN